MNQDLLQRCAARLGKQPRSDEDMERAARKVQEAVDQCLDHAKQNDGDRTIELARSVVRAEDEADEIDCNETNKHWTVASNRLEPCRAAARLADALDAAVTAARGLRRGDEKGRVVGARDTHDTVGTLDEIWDKRVKLETALERAVDPQDPAMQKHLAWLRTAFEPTGKRTCKEMKRLDDLYCEVVLGCCKRQHRELKKKMAQSAPKPPTAVPMFLVDMIEQTIELFPEKEKKLIRYLSLPDGSRSSSSSSSSQSKK